ncbi:hypothetical protein RSOLAG1IB_00586 [Rhizoctonia solani AG-1 IB]|uniref:Uncharacterized protein n=1 Tax=Thanatephorus cucumeris (strain AG1-IB / isolate 7/3/14) TaxID=1108050 RepID=A0A0B7F530_THACB|nr:hypothetical protein RSOLAG1IB_00586 [Rhizoctonia solani AG-1 IB]
MCAFYPHPKYSAELLLYKKRAAVICSTVCLKLQDSGDVRTSLSWTSPFKSAGSMASRLRHSGSVFAQAKMSRITISTVIVSGTVSQTTLLLFHCTYLFDPRHFDKLESLVELLGRILFLPNLSPFFSP